MTTVKQVIKLPNEKGELLSIFVIGNDIYSCPDPTHNEHGLACGNKVLHETDDIFISDNYLFYKYTPSDTPYTLDLKSNVITSAIQTPSHQLINGSVFSLYPTYIKLTDISTYDMSASIMFKSSVATDIILSIINTEGKNISTMCGRYITADSLNTFQVEGIYSTTTPGSDLYLCLTPAVDITITVLSWGIKIHRFL